MSTYIPTNSPVAARFLQPLFDAYEGSDRRYACPDFTGHGFLEMGVGRAVSDSRTGRDFLRRHGDMGRKEAGVDQFFKALGSGRRLANATPVNQRLGPAMEAACPDPFAAVRELDGFAIFAGDGHYHGAAWHDKPMESNSGEMRKYPNVNLTVVEKRPSTPTPRETPGSSPASTRASSTGASPRPPAKRPRPPTRTSSASPTI